MNTSVKRLTLLAGNIAALRHAYSQLFDDCKSQPGLPKK
jgi:hypothetical protein